MFRSGFGSNMFNVAKALCNPEVMFEEMKEHNTQFRSFVEENKDLSVEEMCKKYNVDIKDLKNIVGKLK